MQQNLFTSTKRMSPVFLSCMLIAFLGTHGLVHGQDDGVEILPPSKDSSILNLADSVEQDQDTDGLPRVVAEKPKMMVDETLASWAGVNRATGQIGNEVRSNWIMLSNTGSINGTVNGLNSIGVSEMEIYVLRKGIVVGQTATDKSGRFKLESLKTGAYTIVGYHPQAIFCYGMNAVKFRLGASNLPTSISTQPVTNRGNQLQVGELIQQFSPAVRFKNYGEFVSSETDESNSPHFGWEGLSRFNVQSTPATSIQSQKTRLDSNGRFKGRVHQVHFQNGRPVPIEKTKVFLVASGETIAESSCDRYGVFQFENLAAGECGLVATGADGFAAIGLTLVESAGSTSQNAGEVIDLMLIQPEAIGWINSFVTKKHFAEERAMPRLPEDDGQYYARGGRCPGCFSVYVNARPTCSCRR